MTRPRNSRSSALDVFVNDAVVWLETAEGLLQVSGHRASLGFTTEAQARVVEFTSEPWPILSHEVGGLRLTREVISYHGTPLTLIRWRLEQAAPGVTLCVRPLLSGRDLQALHRENDAFDFEGQVLAGSVGEHRVSFATYRTLPRIISLANADYRPDPTWYRNVYEEEQRRGLDAHEDLASPGVLRFDLTDPIADWIVALDTPPVAELMGHKPARVLASEIREREFRRRKSFQAVGAAAAAHEAFTTELHRRFA
jgi:glycogen debranching enzyme-like protein